MKIIEKSGYQALPWVRYITQSGGMLSRLVKQDIYPCKIHVSHSKCFCHCKSVFSLALCLFRLPAEDQCLEDLEAKPALYCLHFTRLQRNTT